MAQLCSMEQGLVFQSCIRRRSRDDYNMFLVAWERGNFSPCTTTPAARPGRRCSRANSTRPSTAWRRRGELRLESGPMSAGVTYAHEGFIHGCVASTRCFTLQVCTSRHPTRAPTPTTPTAQLQKSRRTCAATASTESRLNAILFWPLHGARVSRAPRHRAMLPDTRSPCGDVVSSPRTMTLEKLETPVGLRKKE